MRGLRWRARAGSPIGAVDARDLGGGNAILGAVSPGEHDEGREGADEADGNQPPDMPDQREAHEGGEERADEARRAVARHFDVRVGAARRPARPAACALPVGIASLPTCGSTAKLNAGGGDAMDHSSERPFHGSPVRSRSSSRWRMLTTSWAIWQHDAGQDDGSTDRRHQQPGMPCRHVVVLHAPRHAHEARAHRAA